MLISYRQPDVRKATKSLLIRIAVLPVYLFGISSEMTLGPGMRLHLSALVLTRVSVTACNLSSLVVALLSVVVTSSLK